jgi:hypothetical protein
VLGRSYSAVVRDAAALLAAAIALFPGAAVADDVEDRTDIRPTRWLARATPGLGYALDGMRSCQMEGRMFVGGFSGARFVAPGLAVGATLAIGFNNIPSDESCLGDLGLTLSAVIGGLVEWYPSASLGLQISAGAGYAEVDYQGSMPEMGPSRGIGGVLGIGYDWEVERKTHALRMGVRLQVTGIRTYTSHEHATLVPALLWTISGD